MSSIVVSGDTSGAVTLSAPAVAGTVTVTLPASGTMLTTASTTGISGSAISSGTVPEAYGGTGTTTGYYGFKNRIINGAMVIDQRNAGASVTLTSGGDYTVDRFIGFEDTDGAMTAQQDSSAPTGFVNSLKCTTTTADGTLASGQYVTLIQKIEGTNVSDLAWGSASAKTVTLSFWVRSSLTGSFGGSLRNSASNRSYPFTYSISVADTWEQKTITIAGDTTGTWLTTTGVGIQVAFGLGVGSTYSGTAGAWAGANYVSATGAVSVIGTLNATWYITGVQLEKGATATAFDYRDYGREMIMCQRYYTQFGLEQANSSLSPLGVAYQATTAVFPYILPIKMRSQPTVSASTAELIEWQTLTTYTPTTYTLPTAQQATQSPLVGVNISPSSLTAGRVYTLRATSAAGYVAFTSEL